MKPRVLFVDDDDSLRSVLSLELAETGFEVRAFASSSGVVDCVRTWIPDAVLLDLRLPGVDGLELLRQMRRVDEAVQVVLLTGHGSVPEAVAAMRLGAHDFLTKPARLDVLEQVLRGAIAKRALIEDNARLRRVLEHRTEAFEMIGSGAAITRLRAETLRVASSDGAVLVLGENGTGKELVARAVHGASRRRELPFVVVNCGAIPENLVESELFGHERGAFTGADRKRIGLFEAAHGGTLFLDEIGELPKQVQPALLRALQFGEVRPVGGDRVRSFDVRVVAATNRDLMALIAAGEFREDLYYRVAALPLHVPPLRERRDDIPELARTFLARSAARMGRPLAFDDAALARLCELDWPGNVRELENAAERLCVMADSDVVDALAVERYVPRSLARAELPTLSLEELERRAIIKALELHGGDKRVAAAQLGIALKTLYNKLDRYGLRPRA
ncbi:MAG: sigma-54-dependent transcriptional regulator [Planctomycetota bacterium]